MYIDYKDTFYMDDLSDDFEEINDIINACRVCHFGTLSIGLAIGIKGALKAVMALEVVRKKSSFSKAKIVGSFCFATAFNVITGCSMENDRLEFTHTFEPFNKIELYGEEKSVMIEFKNQNFESVEQIFKMKDDELFESIIVESI